jgi:phosphoglycerate dehydrogenase-like enzyme
MDNMKKVLIMVPCSTDMQENLIERFEGKYEFIFAHGDHALIEKWLPNVGIIIGEPDEEQISLAQNLKWLQLTWAGTDKYDRMTNLPSDICITNASGAFGKIISEYAVGSIISIYRSFPKYWASKKDKLWERQDTATTIFGKTALVLGTGDIGKNVAHRLKAFDCNVLGIKRDINIKPLADFDQLFKMDDLESVLPKADMVIGCLPNNEGTVGKLDYDRLSLMKKDAVIVNVGRGSLIKTDDLIRKLQEGHLKGAALDVCEVEPLPEDSPLWDMENVMITPHISGPSFGGNKDVEHTIWNICINNLEMYLEGDLKK